MSFDNLIISPSETIGTEYQADDIAPKLNTGSIMDGFCGKYVLGSHGESILNAGMAAINGIVGLNNQNKSTIADGMAMGAFNLYYPAAATVMYNETEGSRTRQDMEDRMPTCYENLRLNGLADNPRIFLTNQTKMFGEEYWEKRLEYGAAKTSRKGTLVETPFIDRQGNFIKVRIPTIESIDSWSMLSFSATDLKAKKSDVSGKERNMIFMNEGMYKTRILREMPRRNPMDGFYSFLTAHLGDKFNLDDPNATPERVFSHLKADKTIKYATSLYTFTMNNLWYVRGAKTHVDGNNIPIYGRNEAAVKEDTDLQQTTVMNLRGKFGMSGRPFLALTSQTEGFLPHLTDLCYLRDSKYYGMGSDTSRMSLILYPDMTKMTRNTVRAQIDEDAKLRRALQLTRELKQIQQVHWNMGEITQTPVQEIFDKVKERGYDWDEILGGTHGHWQFNGVEEETKFLTAMDLIRMAHGKYRPWWMGVSEY